MSNTSSTSTTSSKITEEETVPNIVRPVALASSSKQKNEDEKISNGIVICTDGPVLNKKNTLTLETLFRSIKLNLNCMLRLSLPLEDLEIRRELEFVLPHVIVCMGWKSLAYFMEISRIGHSNEQNQIWFEKLNKDKYVGVNRLGIHAFWVIPMSPPHKINIGNKYEYRDWCARASFIRSKQIRPSNALPVYEWKSQLALENVVRWSNGPVENPVVKEEQVYFYPMYFQYNQYSDKMILHGSLFNQNGTIAIEIEKCRYDCMVGPLKQDSESVFNLESLKASVYTNLNMRYRPFSEQIKNSLELEETLVYDTVKRKNVRSIVVSSHSWSMTEKAARAMCIFLISSAEEGTLYVSRDTPEAQIGYNMRFLMHKGCVVTNRYFKDAHIADPIKTASVSIFAQIEDIQIEPRIVNNAENISLMFRPVYMTVVFGGLVRPIDDSSQNFSSFQVYSVSLSGECYSTGINNVGNELELLCVVFDRIREIKPLLILGHQVTRDIYLLLGRLRHILDENEKSLDKETLRRIHMAFYSISVWTSKDFYGNIKPAIKSKKIGAKLHPYAVDEYYEMICTIPIVDIKNIEFAFQNAYSSCPYESNMPKVSHENAFNWMNTCNFDIERVRAIHTTNAQRSEAVKMYFEKSGYFSILTTFCAFTKHMHSYRSVITTQACEISDAYLYDPSSSTYFLPRPKTSPIYACLDRCSEFSKLETSPETRNRFFSNVVKRIATLEERAASKGATKYPKNGNISQRQIVVVVVKSPIARMLFRRTEDAQLGKLFRLSQQSKNLPFQFIANYLIGLITYVAQLDDNEDVLIDATGEMMEDFVSLVENEAKCIGWDLFGRLILEQKEISSSVNFAEKIQTLLPDFTLQAHLKRGVVWNSTGSFCGPSFEDDAQMKYSKDVCELELELLKVYFSDKDVEKKYLELRQGAIQKNGPILWTRMTLSIGNKPLENGTIAKVASNSGYVVGNVIPYCVDEDKDVVSAELVASCRPKKSFYMNVLVDFPTQILREQILKISSPVTRKKLGMSFSLVSVASFCTIECINCGMLNDNIFCARCSELTEAAKKERIKMHSNTAKNSLADIEDIEVNICRPCSEWKFDGNVDCSNYMCPQFVKKKMLSSVADRNSTASRFLLHLSSSSSSSSKKQKK